MLYTIDKSGALFSFKLSWIKLLTSDILLHKVKNYLLLKLLLKCNNSKFNVKDNKITIWNNIHSFKHFDFLITAHFSNIV